MSPIEMAQKELEGINLQMQELSSRREALVSFLSMYDQLSNGRKVGASIKPRRKGRLNAETVEISDAAAGVIRDQGRDTSLKSIVDGVKARQLDLGKYPDNRMCRILRADPRFVSTMRGWYNLAELIR